MGVALNTTVLPLQRTVVEVEILTDVACTELTVKLIPREVTIVELKHEGIEPPSIWTAFIISPFVGT